MDTRGIFASNASKYGHLNWLIFPLAPGAKVPMKGTAGLKEASANRAQIAVWSKLYPDSNLAVLCGAESGIIVIDIDAQNGGLNTVARLAKEGRAFPDTVEAASPSGGRHLYFAHDMRVRVSGSNRLGRGIDVSTDGHAMVLPPSYWAQKAKFYRWVRPPRGVEFASLPRWVIDTLKPKPEAKRQPRRDIDISNLFGYRRQAVSDLNEAARQIAALQDGRHEAPFKVGASLGAYVHHNLLTQADLEEAVLAASTANGSKYSRGDRLQQLRNGLRKAASDNLPPLARIHRGEAT